MVGNGVRQISVRGELCQETRVVWPTHGEKEGEETLENRTRPTSPDSSVKTENKWISYSKGKEVR